MLDINPDEGKSVIIRMKYFEIRYNVQIAIYDWVCI